MQPRGTAEWQAQPWHRQEACVRAQAVRRTSPCRVAGLSSRSSMRTAVQDRWARRLSKRRWQPRFVTGTGGGGGGGQALRACPAPVYHESTPSGRDAAAAWGMVVAPRHCAARAAATPSSGPRRCRAATPTGAK